MPAASTTTTTTTSAPGTTTTTTTLAAGPRTTFGAGTWRVGTDIAPGRYYADPPTTGCYWARLSGFGGSFNEILANDFVAFDAAQLIVDISPSDRGFSTEPACGTWFNTPRHGLQTSITGGTWLVGLQVAPGTYRAVVTSTCYWERLRSFAGDLNAIIENDFINTPQQVFVTMSGGEVGFNTDASCGTWIRTNAAGHITSARRVPARSRPS